MRRGTLNRELVINQALNIVSENGMGQLTYNGIARSLGVQPQSLYRYGANIADVKSGVIAVYVEKLTTNLYKELLPYSGKEALSHFANYFVSYNELGIPFTDMISGLVSYRTAPVVAAAVSKLRELVVKIIESITTDSTEVEANAQLLLNFVIGTLTLETVRSSVDRMKQPTFDANVDRILALIK